MQALEKRRYRRNRTMSDKNSNDKQDEDNDLRNQNEVEGGDGCGLCWYCDVDPCWERDVPII